MAGPVLGALLRLDTKSFDDPLKKAGTNVRDFARNMKTAQQIINQTATAEEKFAAGQKRLIGLHQQGLLTLNQYIAATRQLRGELGILSVQQQVNARAAVAQEAAMKRAALAQKEFNAVSRIRNNAAISARTAAAGRRREFLTGTGNLGMLGAGLGLSGSTAGLIGLGIGGAAAIGGSIREASSFEQTQTSFRTLLGSKGAADQLLTNIGDVAKRTPFARAELEQGSKALLAYGFSARETIPILLRLGEIAAGLGLNIEDLTRLYGESAVQGRVYTKDLRQFTTRGIDVLTPLAKAFGVTKDEVYGLAEAGKIGFAELDRAITDLSSGRYAGGLVAQSKLLNGQWENLKDNSKEFLRNMGQIPVAIGKAGIGWLNDLLDPTARFSDAGARATSAIGGDSTVAARTKRIEALKAAIAENESYVRNSEVDRLKQLGGGSPSQAFLNTQRAIELDKQSLVIEQKRLDVLNRNLSTKFTGRQSMGAFLAGQAEATRNAATARAISSLISGRVRDTIDLPDHPRFQFRGLGAEGIGGRRKGLRFAENLIPATQSPEFLVRGSSGAFSAATAAGNAQNRVEQIGRQQLDVQRQMEKHLAKMAADFFQGGAGANVPVFDLL